MHSPHYTRTLLQSWNDMPHAHLENRWLFVGIDLAPNGSLESGIAILDRDKTLLRMDKLYKDSALLDALDHLGAPETLIVCLDVPKNLAVPGRFRQEELKYHAMRIDISHFERDPVSRFSNRAKELYDALKEKGVLPFLTYTGNTKAAFEFFFPYKSRSPQGCRALQSLISEELGIKNMPQNLAPSSVLEALLAAYTAWMPRQVELNRGIAVERDAHGYHTLVAQKKVNLTPSSDIRPEWVPL
jgi:predicted nuclease with RNAse H fold